MLILGLATGIIVLLCIGMLAVGWVLDTQHLLRVEKASRRRAEARTCELEQRVIAAQKVADTEAAACHRMIDVRIAWASYENGKVRIRDGDQDGGWDEMCSADERLAQLLGDQSQPESGVREKNYTQTRRVA